MVVKGKVARIRLVCWNLHFMGLSTTRSKFRRVLILTYLLIVLFFPAFARHTSTPNDLLQQCGNILEQSTGNMKLSALLTLRKSHLQTPSDVVNHRSPSGCLQVLFPLQMMSLSVNPS